MSKYDFKTVTEKKGFESHNTIFDLISIFKIGLRLPKDTLLRTY